MAALAVSPGGEVIGVDMTDEQLQKAKRLAAGVGFSNVRFEKGYIEQLPLESNSVDAVISNGVINLCADKATVFNEVARVLKPGGRMAISDIVTEHQLTDDIVCDVRLWASCIGGAMQEDQYRKVIEDTGLRVDKVCDNTQYRFLSDAALSATNRFGVKSISLRAIKS